MIVVVSFLAALTLGQAQPASAETPVAVTGGASTSDGAKATPKPKARNPRPRVAAAQSFSGSHATDQMFAAGPLDKAGATIMRGDSMASMSMNRLADQRALAKKAATLINDGHCPEALQLVVGRGDGLLAGNVAKACGLPEPTIR